MNKINKKLILVVLLILIFTATICINTLYAETAKFGVQNLIDREASNGNGSTVFCLARNYHIPGEYAEYEYTRDNRVVINGKLAKNAENNKTSTNKSNAILAYICYSARGEGANLNAWREYADTKSQNAIWAYWDAWYKNNGTSLGISKNYNKKSDPNDRDKGEEILEDAEVYYNVLNGETGVKTKTAGSGKISNSKYDYDYYGPFKVKKTNSNYVKNTLYITADDNIIGFVDSNRKNPTTSITLSNDYYEFYIRVRKGYTTSSFNVRYKVKQYNAELNLYSYYSQDYGQRFQNLAEIHTTVGEKTISLTLNVNNAPGTVSLQKFIVQSGMTNKPKEIDETYHNSIIDTTISNGSIYSGTSRLNKKANSDSGTNISRIEGYTTAELFSNNKTKKQNPYIINQGEYVVYKIDVYNNSNTEKIICTVKDRIDNNATLIGIFDSHNGSRYYNGLKKTTLESKVSTECYYQYSVEGSDAKYYKWKADVDAGGLNSFFVILQYNTYSDSIINNKAYIDDSNASEEYQTEDYDYIKFQKIDVSLQKYITKVNGISVSSRESTKTREDDNIKDAIKPGVTARNYYKHSNPVPIEIGDSVTYRIYVYNNSNIVAKSVVIKDVLPYYLDSNGQVVSYVSVEKICRDGSTRDIKNQWIEDKDNDGDWVNNNGRKYTISNLAAKSETYFDITVKFNGAYSTKILRNTAWVYKTEPPNQATYRTTDRDYVQMQSYSVSLEKFVSKVNDTNVTDRDGKRYNESLNDGNKNKDPWKSENKVLVEPGDNVTFTIRLRNTGDVPVKVTQIYDSFKHWENDDDDKGLELLYDSDYGIQGNGGATINTATNSADRRGDDKNNANKNLDRYTIIFNNASLIQPGAYEDVTIRYNVVVPTNLTAEIKSLQNKAGIVEQKNINNIVVSDSDGSDNNYDMDWVQTKTYAVSLEKYVYSVNGNSQNRYTMGTVYAEWKNIDGNQTVTKDNDKTTWCGTKWRNPATANKGDIVTYEIIVKNDGNTAANVNKIVDTIDKDNFESAFSCEANYNGTTLNHQTSPYCRIDWQDETKGEILISNNVTLNPSEELKIYLTGTIKTSNMSLDVINNRAKITSLINKNNVAVKDSTEYDNMDEDYIQMGDITISGTVWNDKASNKTSDNYNGLYDSSQENTLDGITVYLYRQGIEENPIATTTTSNGGKYSFSKDSLTSNNSLNGTNGGNGKFIKAPMQYNHWGKIDDNGTNKLKALAEIVEVGESEITARSKSTFAPNSDYKNYGALSAAGYYSYYVVFEYDGITYTSTSFADVTSNNSLDSNAKEDGAKVRETRNTFNSRFSTINNASGITYTTKNENGYIPQSNHVYNASTMAMQSSTNLISLSNDDNLVSQLQHVNLGLRGRDIFDLELTSDVDNIKVTVNEQQGVYQYSNKVTLRKSDLTPSSTTTEDMANKENESSNKYVDSQEQLLRKTDIYNDKYAVNGTKGDTGLGIEVTYKITVTNASQTDGTATKVTNYYDSKYEFKRVYPGENCNEIISAENGTSGSGYNSKTITVRGKTLGQSETMEIYVVYSLKDASTTLSVLLGDGEKRLATYNMAEITEYKTQCASGQTEYTRGLLDKDSAPGSANTEKVRLASGTSNDTTVGYYFKAQNLQYLKYEDDTYATPTLYFVAPADRDDDGDGKPDNSRIIEGTVFEDYTSINSNRVKSGNGMKDSTEPTIKGITVKLIEGSTVRDTTTTDEKGYYKFKDFLPGNYTIKYYYGDTEVTFLKTAPNEESYNGEDFQSTNNSYDVSGIDVHKLSTRNNFWYLDNESEGVSTGIDDEPRRNYVSSKVTAFTDEQMTNLNKVRDGEQLTNIGSMDDENSLIGQTYMYANTRNMLFTVEKSEINDNDSVIQRSQFGTYKISNMNFGIAEISGTTIIDLQKHVESFEITDSTGNNTIASARKNASTGNWELQGDVLVPEGTNTLDVSIEDEKLQGARLQITYAITSKIDVEKNFDGKAGAYATITEVIDYIDNNLSYNNSLGRNSEYWEITERNSIFTDPSVQGTVDPDGKLYTTIVKAKAGNPILNSSGGTATITLEKVLSSSDSTFEEIVTSSVDIYTYSNTVEITGINYENTTSGGTASTPGSTGTPRKDLVITPDRYIIIPKVQRDSTSSGIFALHPPTGDSSINIMYYVIATISLVILAVGTFGIRKFVVKKNKE